MDEHLALERNGQFYYYHADGLGSIVSITDANRNVVQSYEYDSFGIAKPSTSFRNSYTYTGREWDKETGLYFNRARYYDPMEGRFISKDPSGILGNIYNNSYNVTYDQYVSSIINAYAYTDNNPINWVDPEGLFHYKPGVPPASALVEAGLSCMDSCLGTDLGISGGGEKSGHSKGSKHYSGEAADISFRMNPGLDSSKVMCCAKKCGFGFAQTEKDHYHVQTPTGRGGSHGGEPKCGCDK